MSGTWQLQEAKSRLSEVVDEAVAVGPQVITRRGVPVVVVLSHEDYRRMAARKLPLGQFLRESPLADITGDLGRDKRPVPRRFEP
jgi:prevent-host-death family protein